MKNTLLFLWALMLATSCKPGSNPVDNPVISVSIIPQKYFIEQLAGDLVEVNVLIPPGASPATYEPTVSQLGSLERSRLYLRIGYVGFEKSWMDRISSVNPDMKIADLSAGVSLIQEDLHQSVDENTLEEEDHRGHAHHGADPHIWMSVVNARIIAQNITNELVLLFPDQKEYLQQKLHHFSLSLDTLHQDISKELEGVENRKFMIYHPALTYYARDYGLEQFSLEIEGKSPSPAHMKQMIDLAGDHQISKILIQSQFDRKNAEVLAKETGAEIISFDPLDMHWGEQMRYIAVQLNSASR